MELWTDGLYAESVDLDFLDRFALLERFGDLARFGAARFVRYPLFMLY